MTEWIITSCVLIVIVMLLRLVLRGKLSLRLQYGLWLLVLLRLLIPVNFFSSSVSVMNVVPETAATVTTPTVTAPRQTFSPEVTPSEPVDVQLPELSVSSTPVTPQVTQTQTEVTAVLQIIWIAGMAVTSGVFLFANIRFALRLKRSRKPAEAACRLPVYTTGIIDTPCLFGLLRPAIYLTADELDDRQKHHILTHEHTHFRHWDHIWSVLRSLCLILHWYNIMYMPENIAILKIRIAMIFMLKLIEKPIH